MDLLLLLGDSEVSQESYVKFSALLSYPESYVKLFAQLEARREPYLRFGAGLQAEAGNYVKFLPALQREVEFYIRFAVNFPPPAEGYLKFAAQFIYQGESYLRFNVNFAANASYLKFRAALVTQPIIGDLGDGAPANKVGLLSRQYVSVASVKKDVT